MSAAQSALIFGATGQTGRHLLQQLLASSHFTRVGEYGRKVTTADNITVGKEKLEQKVVDFENLEEAGLQNEKWDVIFITLGTTRKTAGSDANFEKIDKEYVVNAARLAKSKDSTLSQRLVYLSSIGANPSSSMLYQRSKGQTEEALSKLGYNDTIIFRPALLKDVKRDDFRLGEELFGKVTGLLSHFSPNFEIKVPILAKAIYLAGKLGSDSLPPAAAATKVEKEGIAFTLLQNSGCIGLANTSPNLTALSPFRNASDLIPPPFK